ncbi:MAG: 1-acyl-sn-glycerol-3-phosphate acyltransferase [Bdellovibrionaceae bacterium]|nr:1-acyl-sn-glycerol-3-phosphate acyltransferase [Pseudobdellovibrionaceae bacterium]NUM57766.1 1-acyl-sn-glycerol-3-phosphate acyltransferase [Pseudobdellovibrionaceae bacterium]
MLDFFAPLRSLVMVAIYPFYTVIASMISILFNLIFNNRKIDNFIIKWWARITCIMFNVSVEVHGIEKIPRHTGCLYLFNHTSFFDIWSMSSALPSFRFGAKVELFKIPFFGKAIERVGVLPIDRQRKETVFRVYEKAKARMQRGERFALSPEGTRQLEPKLAPFKSGPFVFAIQCQAPVVPVVIRNANLVMSKNSFIPNFKKWSQGIQIEVLDPIWTENLIVDDKKKLMASVFEKMNDELNKKAKK